MFTFRSTTIAFFILLLTVNVLALAGFHVPFFLPLLLIGIYLFVSVTMSFFIRSGYHMKVNCRAKTNEKILSVTFDDGPDKELTPLMLDALKEIKIPVTFFCIGKKIRGNEDILQRMDAEGHLIGTHSYSHSNWFDLFSPKRMRNELLQSSRLVFETTGKNPLLFRPPYGVINPMLKRALRGTGFHVIGFSNRAWDTTSRNEDVILKRLQKNLKPGDIIVLHDTIAVNIEVIKKFTEYLHQSGYRIVSLDRLLNINTYEG